MAFFLPHLHRHFVHLKYKKVFSIYEFDEIGLRQMLIIQTANFS